MDALTNLPNWQCKVCLATDEDLKHALLHCLHAQNFWEEACAWFGLRLPNLHFESCARDITCSPCFSYEDRAKIITIMWSIWHSRNRIKHGEEGRDPVSTMRATKEAIALLHLPRKEAQVLPRFGWRPPDEGFVKINTDGGLNLEGGEGVLVVLLDLPRPCLVRGANLIPGSQILSLWRVYPYVMVFVLLLSEASPM